jgi:hypothetical protein
MMGEQKTITKRDQTRKIVYFAEERAIAEAQEARKLKPKKQSPQEAENIH